MLATYEEESGFVPQNESDIMLRMRVLAGEIYAQRVYADYIRRQMFPTTAAGEYLDAHAAQRGLARKNGTKAVGRAVFCTAADEHDDIMIPAGTVVGTADSLRFVTDSDVILRDGATTVTADVTAAQPGSAYNITSGKLCVMVTPVMGVESVRNSVVFSGGTDDETDEQLRKRVVDSYQNISNGANAAYYRSIVMSVDGVYSASVIGAARGVGTVDIYAGAKGSGLSAAKLSEIQTLLDEKREVNVDAKVFNPSALIVNLYIRLTVKEGFDFDTVASAVQAAVTEYITGLGIGRNLLLSDVGEVVYHIEGVMSYKFLETYGSDREIPANRYAIPGSILVRAE